MWRTWFPVMLSSTRTAGDFAGRFAVYGVIFITSGATLQVQEERETSLLASELSSTWDCLLTTTCALTRYSPPYWSYCFQHCQVQAITLADRFRLCTAVCRTGLLHHLAFLHAPHNQTGVGCLRGVCNMTGVCSNINMETFQWRPLKTFHICKRVYSQRLWRVSVQKGK